MDDQHAIGFQYEFNEPRNLGVFVCKEVFEGKPVLCASHDADGDWFFFCGIWHGDDDVDNILLACLEHVVEHDSTLNELASLAGGWSAERATAAEPWRSFPGPGGEGAT